MNINGSSAWLPIQTSSSKETDNLRRRIVIILLLASLLPLFVIVLGSSLLLSRLMMEKNLELKSNMVRSHASTIELYFDERLRTLELAARSYTFDDFSDDRRLRELFDAFMNTYPNAFVDLGVIDETGHHIAYIGPYHLLNKNYSKQDWFEAVLREGSFISDVFLGYRQVPHCIIAVRRDEGKRKWILRATINNDSLYALVRALEIGATGDAYIINKEGLYQTPPKYGKVLSASPVSAPVLHRGTRDIIIESAVGSMVRVTTWLINNRWMLIVEQPKREIMAPVERATATGALFLLFAIILIGLATFFATRHLTARIDRATAERDALSQDFLRSAKLASLGELATGLAHEINNPLAVISAEKTNISDLVSDLNIDEQLIKSFDTSLNRIKRQITRCGNITAKMLQFGREGKENRQLVDIAPLLTEITALMKKQADLRNVELKLDIDNHISPVFIDGNEFEQILVNLINNSMYAIKENGVITVSARCDNSSIVVSVIDTGCGIPENDLERVFQPFFTTKPPGKGTGLGLSVCYGIVRRWGGDINAKSKVGQGTAIELRLPIPKNKDMYEVIQ